MATSSTAHAAVIRAVSYRRVSSFDQLGGTSPETQLARAEALIRPAWLGARRGLLRRWGLGGQGVTPRPRPTVRDVPHRSGRRGGGRGSLPAEPGPAQQPQLRA